MLFIFFFFVALRNNLDEKNRLELISMHSTHKWNHTEFTSNVVRIHTWPVSQDDHMLLFKFTAHFIELDICCTMKSYLCQFHPIVPLRGPNSWLQLLLKCLQTWMFAITHSVVSYLVFWRIQGGCEFIYLFFIYSSFFSVNTEHKKVLNQFERVVLKVK